MSGLGIDFGGTESEAYSTDTNSRTSASTSGFHSRRAAHLLPKKSSMNKLRGSRPKTAEEDARRVRIVSGEPDVLGHGAYTDEDFLSPSSGHLSSESEDFVVQPHHLHSLSAAVAAMGGYTTDTTITSSTETESEASPSLTETSVTSSGSGTSASQRNTLKKHASQPQLKGRITTAPGALPQCQQPAQGQPTSQQGTLRLQERTLHKSKSAASIASGYRSDGGSSLGRTSEIPRGVGRNVGRGGSIRGAKRGAGARRQATLQRRLRPKPDIDHGHNSAPEQEPSSQTQATVQTESEAETDVMIPDGFGGHTRARQKRTQSKSQGSAQAANAKPALLQRIDMANTRTQAQPNTKTQMEPEDSPRQCQQQALQHPGWKVGSFYAPDGSETARLDFETGTLSHADSMTQVIGLESESQALSALSSVSLFRSQTTSTGPRARHMSIPSNASAISATDDSAAEPKYSDGSTKTASEVQNARSRTSLAGVSMRSKRGLQGLEEAETGGALVSLDSFRMQYDTGLAILPEQIQRLDQDSVMGSARLEGHQGQMISFNRCQELAPSLEARAAHDANPGQVARNGNDASDKIRNRPRRSLSETNVNSALLERHGTLLSTAANPLRRSKELNRLLGNSDRKLPSSVAVPPVGPDGRAKSPLKRSNAVGPNVAPPPAVLEQGKAGKARVEVDLVLESDLVVEGGTLRGRMQIKVRKGSNKDGPVLLAQPKIRVVGFEELLTDDTRYIFYHHASVIDGDRSNNGPTEPYYLHGSPTLSSPETAAFSALACFASIPDKEGYAVGKEGLHSIPFSLELPVSKGAKGSYRGKNAVVRYIVIGSVKLKSSTGNDRSIAHFYRHVDLFPYLNPAVVLSSTLKPIQASSSKGLFLGGSGKVHLVASLHRSTWVAGQRLYIHVGIQNDTTKKINSMTLSLIRTVTLYKPRPELDLAGDAKAVDLDPDACQTSTTRKKIAEEELEMGQKGSKGVVTAKGWWTGVEAGQKIDSSHYMNIPSDALSISRGRHVEVVYSIKVSVGSSLSSDVFVELPLRVINFVSLDPPPLKVAGSNRFSSDSTRGWSSSDHSVQGRSPSDASDVNLMVERLKSVEAMRSPGKLELSLSQPDRILSPGEVEAEQNRRLQHQKSLDFINHAIRSAAARRGVDVNVTPTSSASSGPSPNGLGIGILESSDSGTSQNGNSPSSTNGDSGIEEEEVEDNTMTPLATIKGNPSQMYPPGCEPYEVQQFHMEPAQYHQMQQESLVEQAQPYYHQQQPGYISQKPIQLHLPAEMQQQEQMQWHLQMQMQQQWLGFQQQAQGKLAPAISMQDPYGGAALPLLKITNANAVSLDEVGDNYDNDEDGHGIDPDRTLGLNDESMDEMNMVLGSARMNEGDHQQFDESVYIEDPDASSGTAAGRHRLLRADLVQEPNIADEQGWSLRRRNSAEDEEFQAQDMVGEEAEDVAEVSSIMQAVSLTPRLDEATTVPQGQLEASIVAPPPSAADSSTSSKSPTNHCDDSTSMMGPVQKTSRHLPNPAASQRSKRSSYSFASETKPLKISKQASENNSIMALPQQVIRAKVSSEQLATSDSAGQGRKAELSSSKAQKQQQLNALNLKRHSDNLDRRQSQLKSQYKRQSQQQASGLKPLLLVPKATQQQQQRRQEDASSVGAESPDTPAEMGGTSSSESETEGLRTPEGFGTDLAGKATKFEVEIVSETKPWHQVRDGDRLVETTPRNIVTTSEMPTTVSSMSVRSNSSSPDKSLGGGPKSQSGIPRSSTLQCMPNAISHPPAAGLRHSDSTSSLASDAGFVAGEPSGSLSRSHSTHNLRGSSIIVPSVRNKIAMLESRNTTLKEFTSVSTTGSSTSVGNTPTRSGAGMTSSLSFSGRVAQLTASVEKNNQHQHQYQSGLSPSVSSPRHYRLARKGSQISMAESEDCGSTVSSVLPQPDYMKSSSNVISSFNAPVLRNIEQR